MDSGWRRAPAGSAEAIALMRLAETVMPTLERDYLAASLIARAPDGRIDTRELERRGARTANRLAATHGRDARDLVQPAGPSLGRRDHTRRANQQPCRAARTAGQLDALMPVGCAMRAV